MCAFALSKQQRSAVRQKLFATTASLPFTSTSLPLRLPGLQVLTGCAPAGVRTLRVSLRIAGLGLTLKLEFV
jgi:hypothetical protein